MNKVILTLLLLLPFAAKAGDAIEIDSTTHGYLSADTPPPFVVYYIDTVGWEQVSRDSVNVWCDWDSIPVNFNAFDCFQISIRYKPKIDTVIAGYFYPFCKPNRIMDWRVKRP